MKKYTQKNIRNKKYAKKDVAVKPFKLNVKKGDTVKVLTGKDKGKTGEVLRAFPKENKVVVEGIAVHKRHMKAMRGQSGRIVERPLPIHASNVAKVTK
jgi:large subunit ribosomal protein L24